MNKIKKVLRVYFILAEIGAHVFVVWMGMGWPLGFDRWLDVSERPVESEAIVCIAGGTMGNNLPTEVGWRRIYTAVQLYFDGYAPKVVFTGGGPGNISEGEVYAEAAGWLGLPREAAVIDPYPSNTSEHPLNILRIEELRLKRDTLLDIVTSPLHSRRAALCFKKRGFTNFRMVTYYAARSENPEVVRSLKTSKFEDYRPSHKRYDDLWMRLRVRTDYFLLVLREMAAIGYYWMKGYV